MCRTSFCARATKSCTRIWKRSENALLPLQSESPLALVKGVSLLRLLQGRQRWRNFLRLPHKRSSGQTKKTNGNEQLSLILCFFSSLNQIIVASSQHQLHKVSVIQILIHSHVFLFQQFLHPRKNLLVLLRVRSVTVVLITPDPF